MYSESKNTATKLSIDVETAALFINKTCWNGLYKVKENVNLMHLQALSGCCESMCATRDCAVEKMCPQILHIYPSTCSKRES
jgi:hypothetical protein